MKFVSSSTEHLALQHPQPSQPQHLHSKTENIAQKIAATLSNVYKTPTTAGGTLRRSSQHHIQSNVREPVVNEPGKESFIDAGTAASGSGAAGTKTATILVSKSKTKTGLPLLLKNSIN